MSQINSYTKSYKFSLCYGFQKLIAPCLSRRMAKDWRWRASSLASQHLTNVGFGRPEQKRSKETTWGKALAC